MSANVGANQFDYAATNEIAFKKVKIHANTLLGKNLPCFFVSAIATVRWLRSIKAELIVLTLETGNSAAWTRIVTAI
jgi:hypothetical protein